MNEGQGQPGQLDGISLSIIISKNEVNPLTNYKVIQINSKNKQKLRFLTLTFKVIYE